MSNHLGGILARFHADERGVIAILFAVMSTVTFGIMGLAIDYGRASHAQSKLQIAGDAAAKAAAAPADATPEVRKEIAERHFEANSRNSFDGQPQVSIKVDSETGAVTVTASSEVASTVSRLLEIVSIPVSTLSRAIAGTSTSGKKLEVAMMIDLTGSMGAYRNGMKKIDALKLASADLIDIFFPGNSQELRHDPHRHCADGRLRQRWPLRIGGHRSQRPRALQQSHQPQEH